MGRWGEAPAQKGDRLEEVWDRDPSILLRPLCPDDLYEVKEVHEVLFPVRYNMSFYEGVVRGSLGPEHQPLITLVAVDLNSPPPPPPEHYDVSPPEGEQSSSESGMDRWRRSGRTRHEEEEVKLGSEEQGSAAQQQAMAPAADDTSTSSGDDAAHTRAIREAREGKTCACEGSSSRRRRGRIIGVVIAQTMPTATCGDPDLVWPPKAYTEVLYILTLGVLPGYRRRGLAKLLLDRCIAMCKSPVCGAAYLHVITYNDAAIRFYESNRFVRLRTLPEYYIIEKDRFDSHLYIRYMNGAMDPQRATWVSGIMRPFLRLAQSLVSWIIIMPPPLSCLSPSSTAAHRPADACSHRAVVPGGSRDAQSSEMV